MALDLQPSKGHHSIQVCYHFLPKSNQTRDIWKLVGFDLETRQSVKENGMRRQRAVHSAKFVVFVRWMHLRVVVCGEGQVKGNYCGDARDVDVHRLSIAQLPNCRVMCVARPTTF